MMRANSTHKILPTLMVAGVVSLLLSLWLGGFIFYQWVLASEATLTSLVLFAFWLRNSRDEQRKSTWPPLLPLAVIFASGGAKSFYVATGKDTPWLVIVILLAAVVWFIFISWKLWRTRENTIAGVTRNKA